MKRWLVQLADGAELKLYYNNINDIYHDFPEEVISAKEIQDNLHEEYIKKIIDIAEKPLSGDKLIQRLSIPFEDGHIEIKLSCDMQDGKYFDIVRYKIHTARQETPPIGYIISDPQTLWTKVLANIGKINVKFIEHSKRFFGDPKLVKPKELKGIKQSFSVSYIYKKCTCPVFINGDDVWIKHNDYFSETLNLPPEDSGMPLSYISNKYLSKNKGKKFVYDDAWGAIVLRNQAWIKLENLAYRLKCGDHKLNILQTILRQKENSLGFAELELEVGDMARFYENVVEQVDKFCKKNNSAQE